MQKIKDFFSTASAKIIAGLLALVGILFYVLNLKDKQQNALKAKIELANTEKQADLIEVEIKQKLLDASLKQKQIDELNATMVELENKRKQIKDSVANMTPEQVEDYWKKN